MSERRGAAAWLRGRLPAGSGPSVRLNVVANFFATGWTALLGLAVLPLNVRFLGVEAYALLGVFGTVQALSALLDAGLSPTLTRELARLSGKEGSAAEMRTLVRTLEVVYWGLAVLVGALVVALAPLAAEHWLHPARLSVEMVRHALVLMGLTLAIQWPVSFYMGGLQGLQLQVQLSAASTVIGTVRAVGGVLVLWLVSPTIDAFFVWQAVISAVQTAWLGWYLWRRLPPAGGVAARFDAGALRRIWRFAAGVTGHAVLRVLLTHTDKVILSNLLPLETFGYYMLAATLAGALGRLVEPLFAAFFPRFTELVGRRDRPALVASYHHACQLVSVVVLPAAVVLALFAGPVLLLWTRDPVIARESHWLLSLLAAGTALNCLMYMPYGLQLAHGWTRLTSWYNTAAVATMVPALILATRHWGAMGAAVAWLALTATYPLLHIPLMHRRVLRGEARRWYLDDVGAPLVASLAVATAGMLVARGAVPSAAAVAWLAVVSAGSLAAAVAAVPWLRDGVARALGLRARAVARP